MANKGIFQSAARRGPATDTVNEAGGIAYSLPPKQALAQLASTGCLNGTYYAEAESQLAAVLSMAKGCADNEYVAKVAVWARKRGNMKDMPALLVAWLALNATDEIFQAAFDHVIDGGKQLSNFVQILRSATLGKKNVPRRGRRAIRLCLAGMSDQRLLQNSVGFSDPTMADMLRMFHPKPTTAARRALQGWISGRNSPEHAVVNADLPLSIQDYEEWRKDPKRAERPIPDVPWSMLTSLDLTVAEWKKLLPRLSWQWLRANLNTLERQGVLKDKASVELVANRLRDPEAIAKARVMPYQLLVAYLHAESVPRPIVDALHDAMEIAISNAPEIPGGVAVFPDVSGSMSSPVTGHRGTATTKVSCVMAAALIAAAIARRNRDALVIPFDTVPRLNVRIEPRDSVMTNANKLAIGGGGTACSVALAAANQLGSMARTCVYVSDNQSWVDDRGHGQSTATMVEWLKYRARVKNAVLVCIDLQPYATTQASGRPEILNIGGFSDAVFDLLAAAGEGGLTADTWERKIESIAL